MKLFFSFYLCFFFIFSLSFNNYSYKLYLKIVDKSCSLQGNSFTKRFVIIRNGLRAFAIFSELPLTSVEFASDGTNLVLGTSQGLVYLYDLRYFSTPKAVIDTNSKSPVTSVLFQPGGDRSNISALLSSLNKASSIISSNSTQ